MEILKTTNPNIELHTRDKAREGDTENVYPRQWRISHKARGNIGFIYSEPFYNCQTGSIAAMNNIVANGTVKEQRDILATVWPLVCNKRQLIVDLRSNYEKSIEALFNKEEIVFKQPYTSSNGSQMIIFLLRMDLMLERTKGLV